MLKNLAHGGLRIVLALGSLLIALGVMFGVWGYSAGKAYNGTELVVGNSENALIAVSVQDCMSIEKGQSGKCGSITNNMPEILELTVSGGYDYGSTLLPGQTTDLYKIIPPGEATGLQIYDGMVLARWESGKAEINFKVPVFIIPAPSFGEHDDGSYEHGEDENHRERDDGSYEHGHEEHKEKKGD